MGRKAEDINALTETWTQIAGGRIVAPEVSYRQAVRILAERLAALVSPGDDHRPYVQAMLQQGYRRATAYQVVRTAWARAAERVAQAGPRPTARVPSISSSPPAVTTQSPAPPVSVTAPAPEPTPEPVPVPVPVLASSEHPVIPSPTSQDPAARYRLEALPAHIQPGMTFPVAAEGGLVWIDARARRTPDETPFGVDGAGVAWAPYGRDAEGRFRNYFGASLGVAGRVGATHFVGEPEGAVISPATD